MSSTEEKMVKVAMYVLSNKDCKLGKVARDTGVGNPLVRGVLRVMELSNNIKIKFTGKNIKKTEL